jgi:protein TonB
MSVAAPPSRWAFIPERYREKLRERGASITLTVLAHLLLAWLLFHLAPKLIDPEKSSSLNTFSVSPDDKESGAPVPKTRTATRKPASAGGSKAPVKEKRPDTPTPPAEKTADTSTATPWQWGDKSLFAAGDIGALPKGEGKGVGSSKGDDRGEDSASAYGPGEGPGGRRLYNAEWFPHRPSNAELNGYLRGPPPDGGWALIACRTIPDYRVENCQVLGESPLGSGLGRAMREAAWQFRIRAPRINGKEMIGEWVRIRIDFSTTRVGG